VVRPLDLVAKLSRLVKPPVGRESAVEHRDDVNLAIREEQAIDNVAKKGHGLGGSPIRLVRLPGRVGVRQADASNAVVLKAADIEITLVLAHGGDRRVRKTARIP